MKKVLILAATVLFFAAMNLGIYCTVTRKTANNFSAIGQIKMIDVKLYLPFEEDSALARVDTDTKIEGDLPVMDGAAALVPVYASVIDNLYPEGCVTFEGGKFDDNNYYGENFAPDSKMQYKNTVRGFTAVVDGDTDLFLTAYPSEEQFKYAEEQGVELECVPIGREAFVFFVNKDNPVNELTSDQIRQIYNGRITNWNEVGGADLLINPLTRIKGSGSQTMMDKFMGDTEIKPRKLLSVFGGGLGYSFRFYLSGMVANQNVKMLTVDGVYPDKESIRNGTYPLAAKFFVVYRKDNTNPNVQKVVDWMLSDEGQKMIEEVGYVTIN